MRAGKRAMQGLIDEEGVRVVDAPKEWEAWGGCVWANLNLAEDVVRFEERIANIAIKDCRMH